MRARHRNLPAFLHPADQSCRLPDLTVGERLPANLEATAIMRRVQSEGGFAAVLRKGDPDRGTLTLVLRQRGEFHGLIERVMGPDFDYCWRLTNSDQDLGSGGLDRFIAAKARFDPDFWLIELDVADAERFVAETIASA